MLAGGCRHGRAVWKILGMAIPTLDRLPDADLNGVHDVLFESQDYLRRIHWWVRLFGVLWLVVPVVCLVFAAGFFLVALIVGG